MRLRSDCSSPSVSSTNAASDPSSAPSVNTDATANDAATASPPPPPNSQRHYAPHSPILLDPSSFETEPEAPTPPPNQSSPSPTASAATTTSITPANSCTTKTSTLPPPTLPNETSDAIVPFIPPPPSVPPSSSTSISTSLDSAINDMHNHGESEEVAYANGTSSNSSAYAIRKRKLVIEFIEALKKKKPNYDSFLVRTKDLPTYFPMAEAKVLFVMLSGADEKAKKVRVLNRMLIDWIGSKRKQDGGFPSPATINSDVRAFFAATKDFFEWSYSPADFKFDGGYNGYFTNVVSDRQKDDVSSPISFLTFIHSNIIFSSTSSSFIFILHL